MPTTRPKETKLTISNKTMKVDLPLLTGDGLKTIVVNSSGYLGIGFGGAGSDSTPFNGERPITASIPGLQGTTLHGLTRGDVLGNLLKTLYPTQPPTCVLIAGNPQREHGAAPDVILYYNAYPGDDALASIVVNTVSIDVDINQGSQNTATVQDTDTTYTMTATDIHGLSGSASASVNYYHNRYWFQSSTNLLTASEADISTFLHGVTSKEFSTQRQQSRSFTLADEYNYFAYPASFGPAGFIVGGLPNTAYQLGTFNYTNVNGYVETYRLYRSGNKGTGTIQIQLQ